MQIVNQPVRKKDAMQLVTGQPVYMDDMIPEDCLIVKLLRSPHANAVVQEIQTDKAMKVPGIEAIYTWKDIDQNGRRFTCAGQTYPEPSPYDRTRCWNRSLIIIKLWIIQFWCTRKITGRRFARQEQIIKEICAHMRRVNMGILIRYCQTVTLSSTRYIIQKRASRR